MKLNDIVVIEDYTAAREWAVKHGFTLVKVQGGYRIAKPAEIGETEKAYRIRQQRNALLTATDFTQLSDAALTDEEKARFAEYRQYLRDYTKTENWYENNPLPFEEWKQVSDLEQVIASGD